MAEQKRGADPWWSSDVAHAVPITTGIVAVKKLNTARPQRCATSHAAAGRTEIVNDALVDHFATLGRG